MSVTSNAPERHVVMYEQERQTLCLVLRANERSVVRRHVSLVRYTQMPDFETVLGPGLVHHFIDKWETENGEERFLMIGWKNRDDGRINRNLLRIYPSAEFSIDIVVAQIHDETYIDNFDEATRGRARRIIRR